MAQQDPELERLLAEEEEIERRLREAPPQRRDEGWGEHGLLDHSIESLVQLRDQRKDIDGAVKDVQANVIGLMDVRGESTHVTEDGALKATVVRPERHRIREDKLRRKVGDEVWDQITSPALDEDKLASAITLGLIESSVVAACTEVHETTPYVKTTVNRDTTREAR